MLTITGASGTLSRAVSVTLVKTPTALAITATSLPAGKVNKLYSATVKATGGILPYEWRIASGALPPGLTLNASTGVISGTPPTTTKPGSYSFTVSVSDGATQMATQAFSIRITKK